MGKFKAKKLNNQGSTFILALLVITLLTTLALALANASLGNMTMKSIDRGAKRTFYTAETLLDEIRAGIGYASVDDLALAYEAVVTDLIDYNGMGTPTVVDNTAANTQLREKYIDNVLNTVVGNELTFGAADNVTSAGHHNVANINEKAKEYIQSFIAYEDMAEVKTVGTVRACKNGTSGYMVVIEDVSVGYKQEKAGEIYFADITADLEIEFPNMMVDFTTTNKLNDFINYSVIADNSLTIAGQTVNVNASAYAGNMIDIAPSDLAGADVVFEPEAGTSTNINVICGGDPHSLSGTIRVGGNAAVKSKARFAGANIWCTNIATRRTFGEGDRDEATAGAIIEIADNCYTYVKDDFSVDARNSSVTLGGEYYGYMYDGRDAAGHLASSAIIVNGKNSNVSITAKKLFIGGRAYVDVTGAESYMTGEALGLKGDQEIYLVPSTFLGGNPNPMSADMWEDFSGEVMEETTEPETETEEPTTEEPTTEEPTTEEPTTEEPTTERETEWWENWPFFPFPGGGHGHHSVNGGIGINNYAYSRISPRMIKRFDASAVVIPEDYFAKSYLNPSVPYVTRRVGDLVYVYWNFKDKASSAKYVRDVLNGKDIELKNKLNQYTKNLFSDSSSFVKIDTEASNIYATGVFMEATGGVTGDATSHTDAAGVMPEVLFTQNSLDYRNRYEIFTHLLVSIPWEHESARYYVMNSATALEQLRDFVTDGSELTQTSIINNIVDRILMEGDEYNENAEYYVYQPSGAEGRNLIKMIKNNIGTYTVPEDVDGGIIICAGNIELDHDFDGLLLAGGDIKITGNARLTTDPVMIEDLILGYEEFVDHDDNRVSYEESTPFKQYFYAYKLGAIIEDSRESIKIEDLNYKDLVCFNNWRKYED